MITQIVTHYDFSDIVWNDPTWRNEVIDPQFLFRFYAKPAELVTETLFSHFAGLWIGVSEVQPNSAWSKIQNYVPYSGTGGKCRVLESSLKTQHDSQEYKIGISLAQILEPEKEHEFAVMFDGIRFQILCDGIVMDCDFPEYPPQHIYDNDVRIFKNSKIVCNYDFTNDLSSVKNSKKAINRKGSIQFYTPFGSNTWLGDVVVCGYRERFHIFYLFDRRHHFSRHWKGAHEFWHLSTADFIDWTDHGPVVEIQAPWQTIGTGNAFEFQGKLHLSYGLHTERAVPEYRHTKQLFLRNLQKYGHTGEFRMDEVGELLPHGASYISSEDGLHFSYSNRLMHYLVNPSIFIQPDNTLMLCQEGQWSSDHLGDWKLIERDFPPCCEKSFARNCLDCPTFFHLAGWEYCMVGFTAFFGRKENSSQWIDFVELGIDPYDGSNVPMVARDRQNRMIEGGWLGGFGWGSCLLLREIIALGDGRLGKRWLPETLPTFGEAVSFADTLELPDSQDCMLEFSIKPKMDRFSVRFEGKGVSCKFLIDLEKKRAQWSAAGESEVPSFREERLLLPETNNFNQFPHSPHHGRDYAKENLLLPQDIFTVCILIHRDPKLNATLLDAEIAGIQTMATLRNDLIVSSVNTQNRKNSIRSANRT